MSPPVPYTWSETYESALLETEAPKLRERLLFAEQQIVTRLRALAEDHGGTNEERGAIVGALTNIQSLRAKLAEGNRKDNVV